MKEILKEKNSNNLDWMVAKMLGSVSVDESLDAANGNPTVNPGFRVHEVYTI